MRTASIKQIEYFLPEAVEINAQSDPLTKKIGIQSRHVAGINEYVSDIACEAAQKIFMLNEVERDEIDYLIVCTQSPDYLLPSTACIIQQRLGLSTHCGAIDVQLGCSGFVYCLSLATALIQSKQADSVLLLTADTYSKYINCNNENVRPLFGDGACATLITASSYEQPSIGQFIFGTDGSGARNLVAPRSGVKGMCNQHNPEIEQDGLLMNGREIFKFAYVEIPKAVERLLEKEGTSIKDYDYFVFHQANLYILEQIRKKLDIPVENFSVQLEDCGNTVSSSIPIALKRDWEKQRFHSGSRLMLIGFGGGYSWSACSLIWR